MNIHWNLGPSGARGSSLSVESSAPERLSTAPEGSSTWTELGWFFFWEIRGEKTTMGGLGKEKAVEREGLEAVGNVRSAVFGTKGSARL